MATEKMTALTLSGPVDRLDEVIRRFVIGRPLHLEDAPTALVKMRRLHHFETEDPYAPVLAQADALLQSLELTPRFAEYPDDYTLEDTQAYLTALSEKLQALEQEREALEGAEVKYLTNPILPHLKDVAETVPDLLELRYVHARVGRLPEKVWPACEQAFADRPGKLVVQIDREPGWTYVLALAVPDAVDRMDALLMRFGFERMRPTPGQTFPPLTAAEILSQAAQKETESKIRQEQLRREQAAMAETWGEELLSRRAWLKFQSVAIQTRAKAGYSFGRFYLAAWIPSREEAAFTAEFEAENGFSCVAASPNEVKTMRPPIRASERGVGAILSPLVTMYGLPAYGTVDPKLFMVITYTLFFGIMFGDAGQGLMLAILGFALYKKTDAWLWRIIGVCGCSAIAFGLFYGSVFGLEELLPWGGFHPLESEHIMPVLLAGAGVGVVVLVACMGFNIANSLRLGDLKNALFSANGVAGMVLYVAVLAAIVCAYTGAADLLRAWYILPLIALPIALIWAGEPLTKLLEGRPDWKPESWVMFFVEGFFDIFETAISYMSNTMSFLRLGAFAISHAGMMMVVSMLCQNMAAVGTVVVMVLGNILVAGLEAALCSIQIIRLEFYEIFGRFYVSDGRAFSPVTVDYAN